MRTARVLGLVLAALAALASWRWFLGHDDVVRFGDARWYATATPAWRGDGPLYPPEWLGPHVATAQHGFNLPPADAVLGPVASLSSTLWGVLMAACLVGGVALLWPRRFPGSPASSTVCHVLLGCALLAWWPVPSAFAWANVNSLVLLLLAVAHRWPRQAGWAIGAAAAIKVSPVLLLAVLVGRREWRQVGVAVATAVALSLVVVVRTGPGTLVDFVRVQLNETHPPMLYGTSATDLLPRAGVLVVALLLAAVAVARGGSWGWATAAALVWVPTLHLHYWTWALVPALGALRTWCEEAQRTAATPVVRRSAGSTIGVRTPSGTPQETA